MLLRKKEEQKEQAEPVLWATKEFGVFFCFFFQLGDVLG